MVHDLISKITMETIGGGKFDSRTCRVAWFLLGRNREKSFVPFLSSNLEFQFCHE
jgi:hypothetical protein